MINLVHTTGTVPINSENPCGKATVDSTNSFVECACDSSQISTL